MYVAEHAPDGKRGLYTSWIQTTATLGLFLSLLVILVCRTTLGDAFETWGWRIPFLLSIVLLAVSVYIRLQLDESPVFQAMKAEGSHSRAPLRESFAEWGNLRIVLLALFGATAGRAVVWYTGQFYALFFLTQTLKVDPLAANLLIAAALVIGTPLFVVFGALSDRIGRKAVIMAGCLLAAVLYFPVFKAITHFANPALEAASRATPVTVIAAPGSCSFQFDPLGRARFVDSCDIARAALARAGVPYANQAAADAGVARIRVGDVELSSFDGRALEAATLKTRSTEFSTAVGAALAKAGYPTRADPDRIDYPMVLALLTLLVLLVTMVYGPIAAWLVELFPARIRYTRCPSLPHRQRLVRRFPAHGLVCAGRDDRRHLLRSLVPGDRRDDDARRLAPSSCVRHAARRGSGRPPALPDSVPAGPRDSTMELEALRLSLYVALRSVALSLPLAIVVAYFLSRSQFLGRTVLDAIVHLPLVLPPVVVGYVLLLLFGTRGALGAWLESPSASASPSRPRAPRSPPAS